MSAFSEFFNITPTTDEVTAGIAKATWNGALEAAIDRARMEKAGQTEAGREAIDAAICAINCLYES